MGMIFGLIFAGGGCAFFWLAFLQPHIESSRADDWIPVEATLLSSEIEGSGDSLMNAVRFRYEYDGKKYESDQAHLVSPNLSYAEAQRLRDELPKGKVVEAFVNPDRPREAVLFRNHNASLFVAFFAIPFIVIGLSVSAFSLFGKSKKTRGKGFAQPAKSASAARRTPLLCLIGVAFVGMGGFSTWQMGISPILQSKAAETWPEIPCTITKSFVESHSDSDGTTYSVEIRFSYEWEGREYFGEDYTFSDTSSSGRASKKEIVDRYPEGSTATCFVNPDAPYQAVITRDMGFVPYAVTAFTSIFVFVGIGLIFFGLKRKAAPGPIAVTTDQEEVLDGERELTPASGRTARTMGAIFFALIWNAIASIPFFIFFSEGSKEWFLLIIALVFGCVGLFLIYNAVRSILVLRNPLPLVMVAPARLQPGSKMILSWQLSGSASRLTSLAVYLEGKEVARYRRGTRTVTEENVFFVTSLLETTEKGNFRNGMVEFPIPEETVPSMKSDNNEIFWQLVFVGQIPRWPDLCETYEVPLSPAKS